MFWSVENKKYVVNPQVAKTLWLISLKKKIQSIQTRIKRIGVESAFGR